MAPSFSIYGGIAGLYDYGPPGCAVKTQVEKLWREHFVLEEDMLEISGTCLTPRIVLKTSGHVDKFEDYMVKDIKKGGFYRIDKLICDHIDRMFKKKKNMKEEDRQRLLTI